MDRQIDMIFASAQGEAIAHRREIDDLRQHLESLQTQAAQLDAKFNECFEEVDESPAIDTLRAELLRLRERVVRNGNTANDNMDAIQGEIDGIRKELRLAYSDLDELDEELRRQ